MNWLAHVLLSEDDIEFRLGNMLADLVKRPEQAGMSDAFLRGVRRHQAIDAYTDSHPVVRRSRARIRGDGGHTTGILVDVFYDHFLATSWDRYCAKPLDRFTADLYADIRDRSMPLPADAQAVLDRLILEDWLGSYRRVEGIEVALRRLSARLSARVGKEFRLDRAVSQLIAHSEGLSEDLAEFFPSLRSHLDDIKRHEGSTR